MTIARKSDNPKTCRTCANNKGGECAVFIDVVSGMNAVLLDARANHCDPDKDWRPHPLKAHIDGSDYKTIETPMATIHRDPWDKITKTYE